MLNECPRVKRRRRLMLLAAGLSGLVFTSLVPFEMLAEAALVYAAGFAVFWVVA